MPVFTETQADGSGNPGNLTPLTPKVTADNGGDFAGLLQPEHQAAFVADPVDAGTNLTATAAILDALIAAGIMKAS